MRFSFLAVTLACGIAMAGDGPKSVTYLKGNVDGIAEDAGGTLDLSSPKTLKLRSGDTHVEIPYAAISGAERKEAVIVSVKEPVYKVWTLRKKLMPPTPPHEVSFDFKDKTGKLNSLTVEMSPSTADRFFFRVKQAEEKMAANRGEWWGDEVWKTHRNQPAWDAGQKPAEGEVAQR